jgi:hypothetical protein
VVDGLRPDGGDERVPVEGEVEVYPLRPVPSRSAVRTARTERLASRASVGMEGQQEPPSESMWVESVYATSFTVDRRPLSRTALRQTTTKLTGRTAAAGFPACSLVLVAMIVLATHSPGCFVYEVR